MKTTRYLFAILISVLLCCCSEEKPIGDEWPWGVDFGTYISIVDENGKDLLAEDATSNNLYQKKIILRRDPYDCVVNWSTPPDPDDRNAMHVIDKYVAYYFYVFPPIEDYLPDFRRMSFDLDGSIFSAAISSGKSLMLYSPGGVYGWNYDPFPRYDSETYTFIIDGLNVSHTITFEITLNDIPDFEPPIYRYFLDGEETSLPITIVIPRAELANLPE